MPLVRGRKRRSGPEEAAPSSPETSPERPTQRRRISTNAEDAAEDAYTSDNAAGATQSGANLTQMVKKMVRLALACEYQRRPIRRMEIGEKVLGSDAGRQFKSVFNQAQVELRSVFGMEMVELPGREKITVAQKRAAQKQQSQQTKTATSWVLISILPSRFRHAAILSPPAAPTPAEDGKYTAIYSILIAMILLSGGALPDAKMERALRRLNMQDTAPLDGGTEKTEKLFKRMDRDGYVVKIKERVGSDEDDVFWIVGPRGKVEVGERGVEGMVKAVYGELEGEELQELERKITRSLGLNESVPERNVAVQDGERRIRGGRDRGQREEEEDEDSEDEA